MKLLKGAFLLSNSPKRKRENRRRDAFASSAGKLISLAQRQMAARMTVWRFRFLERLFPFLSGVVLLRKKVDVLFPFLFSKPLSLRCGLEAESLLHVRRRLQSGRKRKSEKKNKQKYTKEKSWIETKLFSAEKKEETERWLRDTRYVDV